MNKMQNDLIKILNTAIHGDKIDFDKNENVDWKSLIEEAKAHKVEALCYAAIGRNTLDTIDKEVLETWKKDTFMSGIWQINHIKNIGNVLKEFNKSKVPVVVLKGLVVRNLYPKHELRTMCDADILVYEKDLEYTKELLLDLGFEQTGCSIKHMNFIKNSLHIEVHWNIANTEFFDNILEFENNMWNNAVEVKVGQANVLSMCDEDLALHLCIHMAEHIKHGGFGIRQLADLVLLVEQKGHLINWNNFRNKSKESGVYKFTAAIFMLCNRLFNMDIPKELEEYTNVKGEYLDVLINDIFSSGVHGKKEMVSSFAGNLASTDENDRKSILENYMNLLFPPIENMSDKYSYAKKYKLLAPIAWIHHLLAGVFNKQYSLIDKVKFTLCGMSISKKRNELLNWLEL